MLKNLFVFKPDKQLMLILLFYAVGVIFNFFADLFGRGSILFYIFYQGIFALGICIFIPLFYTAFYKKENLSAIGISFDNLLKSVIIGIIIAAITVSGSMIHKIIIIPSIDKLIFMILCLMMSTLFEEVFFRGFLQTTFEKYFGIIPAIIFSGICFGLYHIGYKDMRNLNNILILIIVGIVFSISFRITKNIITSYIVNLPNAILTFLDKKTFNVQSAIISLITFIIGLILIYLIIIRLSKTYPKKNRIPETFQGITGEFLVSDYDEFQRTMRDKGYLHTDKIIKSGINMGTVLEIGPGPGYLGLEWLKKTTETELYWLEISENMKNIAMKNAESYGVKNRVNIDISDATKKFPYKDKMFDAVFSSGSLHEWADPVVVLNEINRVLKPCGKFFIGDLKRNINPFLKFIIKLMNKKKSMKKGFVSSINAAYLSEEIKNIIKKSTLRNFEVKEYPMGLNITGSKNN